MESHVTSPKKRSPLWIEIERRQKQVKQKKKITDDAGDCAAVLLLTRFAETPRISFGKVAVEASKEATLVVKNPLEDDLIVTVEKVPEKKGFSVDLEFFDVKKLSEQPVKIVWTPKEAGNYRELVTFRLNAIFCKQVILLGSAVSPLKRVLRPQNRGETEARHPSKIKFTVKKGVKSKIVPRRHQKSNENKLQMTFIQRKSIPGLRNLSEIDSNDKNQEINATIRSQAKHSPKATVYLRLTPDLQLRSSSSQPEQGLQPLHSCEDNMMLSRRQTYVTQPNRNRLAAPLTPKPQRTSPEKYDSCASLSERRAGGSGSLASMSPESIDRRQTYSKNDIPCLIPIHSCLSPESSSSSLLSSKRSKIPEPIYKLKSRSRRHSDASDFNDSLENDLNTDFSSITTDESESKRSLDTANFVGESKKRMDLPKYFATEQTLQITELDYSDFCGKLNESQSDWTEMEADKPDECFDDEDEEEVLNSSLFRGYKLKCSTDRKPVVKICNAPSLDSRRELFLDKDSLTTFSSDTFVMSKTSSSTSKEEPILLQKRRARKKSGIPSLQKKLSEAEELLEKEKNLFQAKAKRNNSKTPDSSVLKERGQNKKKKASRAAMQQIDCGVTYRPKLTLIKPPSKALTPCHPNPYAAKNIYYDEQWIEKQTQGFTRWLNFILTIPDELGEGEKHKMSANATLEFSRDITFKQAPSREELSIKTYTVQKKMNLLRRKACNLYQSESIIKVITRLEHEIENRRIAIRSDKALHADVGIKQKLVELIMSYNSLWLRIGLETVFGQIIQLRSNDDTDGLSQFLLNYLMNSPIIAKEYAHPSVPHLFKPGFATSLKKHTLKKFLLLVYFLDQAKENYLIEFNPCLFNIESKFKSSRDILLAFSRDHLSGEGDVTKHLAYFGYKVVYAQTALDEYDFSVSNLAVDLRNGLRLARAAQLLTQNWSLMTKLRVPAVTRMQKIHNVTCVLNILALNDSAIIDVTAKDVVNGHREKTLSLLWQLMFNFQVKLVLCEEKLKNELEILKKSLHSMGIDDEKYAKNNYKLFPDEKIELLLRWCQLVCAHYKIMVDNFTVSFSDGRVICYLINFYHPDVLRVEDIMKETTQSYIVPHDSVSSDDSFTANWTSALTTNDKQEQLLRNEQDNFKLALSKITSCGGIPLMIKPNFMSNTIPDEKVTMVFVSYLCAQFIDLSAEIRAANVIQKAWRTYQARCLEKSELQNKIAAAIKIQHAVRSHFCRPQLKTQIESACKIQRRFRSFLLRQQFVKAREDMIKLQAYVRSMIARRRFKRQVQSAIVIQKWARMFLAKKLYERIKAEQTSKMNAAATTIQTTVKGFLLRKRQRKDKAARVIQRAIRSYLRVKKIAELDFLLQEAEKDAAATSIQSFWRMCCARMAYELKRSDVIKIQACFRGYLARETFIRRKEVAIVIQTWYKRCIDARKTRARFVALKEATIKVQRWYRLSRDAAVIRKRFLSVRKAAVVVQDRWRSREAATITRARFLRSKRSVVTIQRWFRRARRAKQQRAKFLQLKRACVIIEQWYRRAKEARVLRKRFLELRRNAITIQRWYRSAEEATKIRVEFLDLKWDVISIQRWFRRTVEANRIRIDYLNMKWDVITIQRWYRLCAEARKTRMRFLCLKRNAVTIQRWFRRCVEARKARMRFLELRRNAVTIQRWYRWAAGAIEIRIRYMDLRWDVITIQRWFRSIVLLRKTRMQFLEVKRSVVVIQQWFRSNKKSRQTRTEFLEQKRAALSVQQWYRRLKEARRIRRVFLESKMNAVKIQRWYRSTVKARQTRTEFLRQKRAAVTVQQWYKRLKEAWRIREEFLESKMSVVKIQRWYRSTVKARQARTEFLKQKRAALSVQQWYRRLKEARMIREEFLESKMNAVKIQRWYRSIRKARQTRTEFLKQRRAAVTVQQWYRQLKEARRIRRVFLESKVNAEKIQRWYRWILNARQTRTEFLKQKRAALSVQQWFRRLKEARRIGEEFLKSKMSVLKIQRWYRSMRKARETRNDFLSKKEAAVIIQRRYRRFRRRKRFLQRKRAVLIIQRWYRRAIVARKSLTEFIELKRNVVVIQRWYRRAIVARKSLAQFIRLKRNVVVIQRWYRRCKQSEVIREEFLKRKQAAICLQNWFRRLKRARNTRAEFLRRKRAAKVIKEWLRRSIDAKKTRMRFLRTKQAAVVVQRWYRRVKEAKKSRELNRIVIVVQRWYRRCTEMKKYRTWFIEMKRTVIRIQQWYRSSKLAVKIRTHFVALKRSIVFIQKLYRLHRERRRDRERFLRVKRAAVTVQRWYRSVKTMRKERDAFRSARRAVIGIQRRFRTRKARRNARLLSSAVAIQRWYRRSKLAREIRTDYLEFLVNVVRIQRRFRSGVQTRKLRTEFLEARRSAVVVQRWWRRCSETRRRVGAARVIQRWYKRSKEVRQKREEIRVCKIQDWYRRCKKTRETRRGFLRIKRACVVIQRWFGRVKTVKEIEDLMDAVLRIQRFYRGWKETARIRSVFVETRRAAIVVQRRYRAKKCRARFLRMKMAAVAIQKWNRSARIRREFLGMKKGVVCIENWYLSVRETRRQRARFLALKNAAVCVQRLYRERRAARTLERENWAVVTLQRHLRGWIQWRRFAAMKRASTIIQRQFRLSRLVRSELQSLAVVTIQTYFRGYLETRVARRQFLRLRSAAVVVQKYCRMRRCLKDFTAMRTSILVVQRFVRACLEVREEREALLSLRWAAGVVQGWFRACNERRSFKTMRKYAIIVQKNYRRNLYRREFLVIKKSAILIQTTWRRSAARRMFLRSKEAAIYVQSAWRGYVERRRLRARVKAAVCIEKWYRSCVETRRIRAEFVRMRSAAVRIQAWVRCRLAVRKYERIRKSVIGLQRHCRVKTVMLSLYNKVWAIQVLQQHWVAVIEGRKARKRFLEMKYAATTLQSWFRMLVCQRELARRINCAIKIQKTWRMVTARRNFLLQKRSVLVLEDWVISCWERRVTRESYLTLKYGVVLLQAMWRRYRARERARIENEAARIIQNWYYHCQLAGFCRAEYLELRYYTIRMQATRRGAMERRRLFYLHEAAVVVQSAYRGWCERTNFRLLRGCAIVIQRFWRNCQLTRLLSEEYVVKRTACVMLQASIRGFLIRRRYLFVKFSAILVQSYIRGWSERKRYLRLRAAVVVVQRCWRSRMLCRWEFTQYHVVRGAVIVIQSYLRGHIVRSAVRSGAIKRCANFAKVSNLYDDLLRFKKWKDYHILRGAAITIQAWARGWMTRIKLYEDKAERRRDAVVRIQAAFRGVLTRRKLEKERCVCWKFRCGDYVNFAQSRRLRMLNAVGVIERFYQCYKVRQVELLPEEQLKIKVQGFSKWTRRLLLQRRWFLVMRTAATIIQCAWQAWVLGKAVREWFWRLRAGTVGFQAAARGFLVRRAVEKKRAEVKRRRIKLKTIEKCGLFDEKIASRENYLKCFAAAAKLQLSALRLQRWIRKWNAKRRNSCAIVIQAAWRGYKLRSAQNDRRISDARSRINEANQSAVLENTLWNRTTSGLDSLFNCRRLSTVWKALNNLNASTRLSPVCCERLANSGGIVILYQIIEGCNRSVPHMEIILECLSILVNLAKHEPSRTQVWQPEGCGLTVVKLMRHYFEKNEKIVLKCCSLFWIICRDKACVKLFARDAVMMKSTSNLCAAVSRRFPFRGPLESSPIRASAWKKVSSRYTFQPDWVLGNDVDREFVVYVKAFPLVIDMMKSWL